MTVDDHLGPLAVELEIAATPARAFELWTERAVLWWPLDHTLSGDPRRIVFEPFIGGRICEETDHETHVWGRVQAWDPPHRLAFSWHLFFTPDEATDVTITFAESPNGTVVQIEQTGWDRLGAAGPPRRERTGSVWGGLLAHLAQVARE